MEARKITIVQTKNQKRSVIMSSATTLAELKADLRANNIDYSDMTFFEGTSKTELKADSSVLPHDVPWKGTTTNELVFMLTNTNKKIKSGICMTRIEILHKVKAMGLQGACMNKFGKNYTQCKSGDLLEMIEANTVKTKSPKCLNAPSNIKCVDTVARAAITELVDILKCNGIIDEEEKEDIIAILGGEINVMTKEKNVKPKSPYSDDEIDNMFDFV